MRKLFKLKLGHSLNLTTIKKINLWPYGWPRQFFKKERIYYLFISRNFIRRSFIDGTLRDPWIALVVCYGVRMSSWTHFSLCEHGSGVIPKENSRDLHLIRKTTHHLPILNCELLAYKKANSLPKLHVFCKVMTLPWLLEVVQRRRHNHFVEIQDDFMPRNFPWRTVNSAVKIPRGSKHVP